MAYWDLTIENLDRIIVSLDKQIEKFSLSNVARSEQALLISARHSVTKARDQFVVENYKNEHDYKRKGLR